MDEETKKQIDNLKRRIEAVDITMEAKAVKEWGGADVVSAGEKGGHFHRNKWVPVLERA